MLQRSSGDLTRLDLAQDATSLFVDRLDLPRDRAAVVVFQTAAEVLQPVTGDRGALQTALAKLHGRVADGSRLDLGLAAAAGLLANPDAAANRPVIVLLTDGQPEDVAATRAIAAAVRDAGVTLYTVGLGADVDDRLLAELAGRPARCLVSPDGVDLNQIYLEIARRTGCADPP